jgi:hypothetical protein
MADDTAKPAPPRDDLADAIMNIGLKALCDRLDIKPDRSTEMWTQLGIKLAFQQPEFRGIFGKKVPGRPKGSKSRSSDDLTAVQIAEEISTRLDRPFDKVLLNLVKLWQDNGCFLGDDADNPPSPRAVFNRLRRIRKTLASKPYPKR